jgi:hypothetical protein
MTEAKRRPPAVHAGAKRLVAILLAKPGIALAEAAEEAGLNTRSAKVYLGRPHVIAHYRAEKQRLIEEIALGNPAALAEARDRADNSMSRVAAAKALDQMRVEAVQESGGGTTRHSPGLVVIIETAGQPAQIVAPPMPALIDVTPERDSLESPGRC